MRRKVGFCNQTFCSPHTDWIASGKVFGPPADWERVCWWGKAWHKLWSAGLAAPTIAHGEARGGRGEERRPPGAGWRPSRWQYGAGALCPAHASFRGLPTAGGMVGRFAHAIDRGSAGGWGAAWHERNGGRVGGRVVRAAPRPCELPRSVWFGGSAPATARTRRQRQLIDHVAACTLLVAGRSPSMTSSGSTCSKRVVLTAIRARPAP